MLHNYFTIAWRNLLRTKTFSFINLSGLAIGMAVAIVIGLWLFAELNFNRSFVQYKRIYSIYHHLVFGNEIYTESGVSPRFAYELRNNFPEFESVAMTSYPTDYTVSTKDTKFSKPGLFVEPQFIEMFSLQPAHGTSEALNDIHSIMLSKSFANIIFNGNAVGKTLKFDNGDDLVVTAIFEDFPMNSEFGDIKMLMPMEYYFTTSEVARKQRDTWDDIPFQGFVLLSEKSSHTEAEAKIKKLLFQKGSVNMKGMKPEGMLFPMEKWHLYSEFKDGKNVGGKIRFVWMFGLLGAFVLILACINFMNLSTARSEKRSKEVGVRKVMGSLRKQLVGQFLSESFIMVVLSFFVAIGIVILCLPLFNEIANTKMEIPWSSPYFIMISTAFIIVTSLLAGSYPALLMSSFSPVKALKGSSTAGRHSTIPRKIMVVFQFTISIVLTIATIVVFQQIQHGKDRPVGFDREGILHVRVHTQALAKANYNSLRNDMLSTGVVEEMAKSDSPISGNMWTDGSLTWEGKDANTQALVAMNGCSHDFPAANGFQFVEGRDFSREFSSDSSAVIVNELAAKLFSSESVIGKKISLGGKQREIVGVIKDQVRWSPFSKQSPHIYLLNYVENGYLTIRLNSQMGVRAALDKIAAVISKYDDAAPFEYKFLDDDYARMFQEEERTGKLATVFTVLALFISCLGIFGLASFTANQRTKEISIRKVLGATVFNVWKMLSQDFVRLVAVSILVASPLAYYFAYEWLQQYEYRIEISWWIFACTAVLAIVITLLTVSYQAVKAALINPINSLKSD